MAEYGGQMMGQQYGISEVGHSPAGMHRMPGQHSSPQQPLFHGQQHSSPQQPVYTGQHSSPQQPVYQGQHASPQQTLYQSQRSSPQQPVSSQILQNQHQLLSNQTHQSQPQSQQQQQAAQQTQQQPPQQQSMIVTSVGQQMISSLSHGPPQTQQHQLISNPQNQHQMMPSSSQQHQIVSQSGPHQILTTSTTKQHQILTTSQHQMISPQGQHQILAQSPQFIQHQPVVAQQPVAQTSFAVPAQAHLRQQNPVYQQSAQHRVAAPRFATSSENRGTLQRSPSIQRVQVGQSSAIRQALGHITSAATPTSSVAVATGVVTTSTASVSTATTTATLGSATTTTSCPSTTASAEPISLNGMKLLEKDALETLIKSVDPFETVEDDVSDALKQLVEEFVDEVIEQTARVARHRGSTRLESKDVRYVLEKRFKIFLPAQAVHNIQQNERTVCTKSPTVEAHRQRMNLIKKTLQKP
uniref:Transcription initiation factor TFIID subunit 12 n=1 Tax=Syphacia muris TaxID=451379 RepID=A0A0N5AR07_9BILA